MNLPLTLLAQTAGQGAAPARLPAEPPIGGLLWTLVVPALLLALATLGTYLLYRRFARSVHEERER